MDSLWQDLRYGVRTLLRQPGFTAAAVLTLAIGVGVNAAIFSVCQTVLFKQLPYAEPERLVMVWERQVRDGTLGPVAPANFVDWRNQSQSFEQLVALNPFPEFTMTGRGNPERLAGAAVSVPFFSMLGTSMALGRSFREEEAQLGRNLVVILSHQTWQRLFAGDPAIVGQPLTLNNTPFTVIGVLPRDFHFVSKASDFEGRNRFDAWVPLALNMQRLQRGTHPFRVFGQLRAGVSLREAQAELDVIGTRLERDYPADNADRGITAVRLAEQVTADVRPALLMLLVAVGLVLLIACVNVANLLLGRAVVRQKEMAVRLALGAGRLRLGRQLVTESLLLASMAAAVGVALAWWTLDVLALQLPVDLPRLAEIGFDIEVLLFIAGVSLTAGIVFGLAPLTQRVDTTESLKEGRHGPTRAQLRTRSILVVTQIALACILLVGAGLVGRSLFQLLDVAPGFRSDGVLTAKVTLPINRYADVQGMASFQSALLGRVRQLPEVRSAGVGGYLPLGGADNSWAPMIEGRPPLPAGEYIQYRPATPGYLETLGISIVEGRDFRDADAGGTSGVAIVNQAAARKYWPNQSAIGRRLQIGGTAPPWRSVVGVVADVRHEGLDVDAKPELYLPFAQLPFPNPAMVVVLRTASDPMASAAGLRRALAGVDPNLPLTAVQPMAEVVRSSVGAPRFRAMLLGVFGGIALILAAIGVYGVMSYFVTQRLREFGVRVAFGATRGDVLSLVLKRSAALLALGLGFGLAGSLLLARFVQGLLYGITPHDGLTLLSVTAVLAAVALVASYLPARRATLVNPADALRTE